MVSNQLKNRLRNWRNEPYIMFLFLGLQLLVFLVVELYGLFHFMGLSGSENTEILKKFGALTLELVAQEHQWWRLITPIFLHIGFAHLAVNSVALYFVGKQLEELFGHARFFVLYLLAGILGNAMSLGLGTVGSVSAGASTSLFGLFAVFVVLGKIFKYNASVQAMSRSMTMFIIMNLVFNLFSPNVDILGHIGGAIGGVLATYIVALPVRDNRIINLREEIPVWKRVLAVVIYLVLMLIFIMIALNRVRS